MKKYLLLLAIAGITAAWVNKPHSLPPTVHNYSFTHYSTDGTRMYYGKDLTDINYVKGFDYICLSSSTICTFMGNTANAHTDLTGNYFYTSDVPPAGIDDSGIYYDGF